MKSTRIVSSRSKPVSVEPLKTARSETGAASMVRTQLYLNRDEHAFVQAEAARTHETMAGVIRALVRERMEIPARAWENNPLLAPPADQHFRGPKDGVLNHDHYVSGGPRRWVRRQGRWAEAPPLPTDYFENPASAAAYDSQFGPQA